MSETNRKIELLSPAKDVQTAKSAILCGADSVYIGAHDFGARAAASNSIGEIAELCSFAGIYGVKIYVAVNTILSDSELPRAQKMLWDLYDAGVDAAIIQDLGLLKTPLPPMAFHASTQCHVDSPDKARFLEACGFKTIVLARELSLSEIQNIRGAVSCRLECFVHGALCVSYSGQCYMSLALGGRSGNRGVCAQPCRMKYELLDARGREIAPPSHYLSLRDMNRSAYLGEMLDAGVDIFKIEGRLKDSEYVKNTTAAYRRRLDAEISKRPLMSRASFGESKVSFLPDPNKSFNRGFCLSRLFDRREICESFSSPKSRGEKIGVVQNTIKGGFIFEGADKIFSNNDGLLFENATESTGAAVRGVSGNKVLVGRPDGDVKIPCGATIWRNRNVKFEADLKTEAKRFRPVLFDVCELSGDSWIFSAKLDDVPNGVSAKIKFESADISQNRMVEEAKITDSLSKLGGTAFSLSKRQAGFSAQRLPHLKISECNSIRRTLVDSLAKLVVSNRVPAEKISARKITFQSPPFYQDERANIFNESARSLYSDMGFDIIKSAPEAYSKYPKDIPVARTRHCILRELGMCKKQNPPSPSFCEPFKLRDGDRILRLHFNCTACEMEIFKE